MHLNTLRKTVHPFYPFQRPLILKFTHQINKFISSWAEMVTPLFDMLDEFAVDVLNAC